MDPGKMDLLLKKPHWNCLYTYATPKDEMLDGGKAGYPVTYPIV